MQAERGAVGRKLTGAISGWMFMRDEVRVAAEELADAAEEWRRAYDDWQRAAKARDRVCEQLERRVAKATGGLSVARWELLCRRRRTRTVEDAKAKARAMRARSAVEEAVAERDRVLAGEDAKVLAARVHLAEVTKIVLRFGLLGAGMAGQGASELRRLARRPPTPTG